MKITRIDRQKKRRDRVSLHIDDEFATGISVETLLTSGLRAGDEITQETLDVLQKRESLLQGKNSALRLLSLRPRSEKEIRDRLRSKEFSESEIDSVVSELRSAGLLNDEEFARRFIRNALTLKPVGRILLQKKLLLLGVDRSVVEQTLDEECGEENQMGAAREAGTKALRRISQRGTPQQIRDRLMAAMLRRGFPFSVVKDVVRELLTNKSDK